MSTDRDIIVRTDYRGRANLSRLSRGEKFLARQEEDGTIVLTPAKITPEVEK